MFNPVAGTEVKWNGEPLTYNKFVKRFEEKLLESGVRSYYTGLIEEPIRPEEAMYDVEMNQASEAQRREILEFNKQAITYTQKSEVVLSTLMGMLGTIPKQKIARIVDDDTQTFVQRTKRAFRRVYAGNNMTISY